MEFLLILTLFVAFGLLATRYGYDSRDGARSREQELASYGVVWPELTFRSDLAGEIERARQMRLAAESLEAA